MKRFTLVVLALVTFARIGLCDGEKPERGGWFVYGIPSDITSYNPYLTTNADSSRMAFLMYNGLLAFDDKLEITGDLAEKWEVSPDGKTYTFWIKKGVKWHDGQELTADDVE